ncbi:MAG: hypothetical protein JJK57_13945 [Komagataeibacter hansenii]|nr:hypothetical protein [Novacetimonas hansenii]
MACRDMIGDHAMPVTIGVSGTGAARPASMEVSITAALSIGSTWSIVRHTGIERSDPASALTS